MRKIAFIIILILVLGGILFYKPFTGNYEYYYLVDDLPLVSNTIDPQLAFQEISQKQNFNIITTLHEPITPEDSYRIQGITKMLIVLIGNKKDVTQIYKVQDTEGNLLYCQTNKGDNKTQEQLTPSECLYLESQNYSIILHSHPQDKKILFTENTLEIFPQTLEDYDTLSSYTILKLFSNAEQLLNNFNLSQQQVAQG